MGVCETPEEVFEWLRNPESLQKCLDKIDGLIDNID
jgi:carbon monoxide dehydrogenase subunit G